MTTGADQLTKKTSLVDRSGVSKVSAVLAWLALALVVVVTIGPVSWRPDFGHVNVERFTGFGVLSFLFVMGYPRRWFLTVSILCAVAVGLELLQFVIPGRDASLFNALVKLSGCAAGAVAGRGLNWLVVWLAPRRP